VNRQANINNAKTDYKLNRPTKFIRLPYHKWRVEPLMSAKLASNLVRA
jgi:hypothetical protein